MNHSTARRGFTLLELMVVVVIVGVVAAMVLFAFGRQKGRQEVDQMALELRALMNGARQTAFATGEPVALLIFPGFVTPTGTGRFILYRDGNFSFFSGAAAVNMEQIDAARPVADSRSEVLETIDLPLGIVVGPPTGQGAAAVMPAPFAGIIINQPCAVCTGRDGRGAFVFQPNGSVTFHDRNGPPLNFPQGASLSLVKTDIGNIQAIRTLAVTASTGAFRTLKSAH